VLSELRRLHREGMRVTANELVANEFTGLLSAVRKYVGSLVRARRLARIPPPGRLEPDSIEHWDEQRIVDDILARHRQDEPLSYKQVPTKLADAAVYYFGTWKAAIEAAGVDYAHVRRTNPPWSRERIIAALRAGAATKRRGVTVDGAVQPALSLAARRAFGSVRAALHAANVDPASVFRRVKLDDNELRTALKRLIAERRTMTLGDMRKSSLGRVVVRRFGSIEQGLSTLKLRWKPERSRRGGRHPRR
jgi:hypothetical protein